MNTGAMIENVFQLLETFDNLTPRQQFRALCIIQKRGSPELNRAFSSRFKRLTLVQKVLIDEVREKEAAYALLLTMVFSAILLMGAASLLSYVYQSAALTDRYNVYESTFFLADSGIELAYGQINGNTNWPIQFDPPWEKEGFNTFHSHQTLGAGSFDVWITNGVWQQRSNVVIVSTGTTLFNGQPIRRTVTALATVKTNNFFHRDEWKEIDPL